MPRAIRDSVVVITGASSGIGRATALAFAHQGANLVLGARCEEALRAAAEECENLGGHAVAVPTDVTSQEGVDNLAAVAVERFGRVDTWVNNAAVTLFGRFEETPPEDYHRVLDTNINGYIHGARAALPHFREQGSGTLINVASVVAAAGQPYTSAYVTSKYAIRGFSECLRMELSLDRARDIHVCTVMPASIDTPLFQHAANYTGRAAKALEPVYEPERVAATIVGLARRPRREVVVGSAGRVMMAVHALSRGLYEPMFARQIDRNHLQRRPAEPTRGNLFEPMPEFAEIRGGWMPAKPATTMSMLPLGLAVAVAVPAVLWAMRRNGNNGRRARLRRGGGGADSPMAPLP
jgi:NAD(P)-dependent dehydrogenase (short-subunit alcohol dehydrogenase family)